MKKENLLMKGYDHTYIPVTIWSPDEEPRIILQIIHGMTEHVGRYEELAEELTKEGIVVAGFDLRGHGRQKKDPDCASMGENGWKYTLKEMRMLNRILLKRHPKCKVAMLGFSLGSFLLRDYLSYAGDHISYAILVGTGYQPAAVLGMLKNTAKKQIKKHGFDCPSKKVNKLTFGTYNKKFKPNVTSADWICSDEKERELYLNDRFCTKEISNGLFLQLLEAMHRTGEKKVYEKWNKNVNVLLLSGEDDPVGDFGKGVKKVFLQMEKAEIENVELTLIEDCRHDLLHEKENGGSEEAIDAIKEFLE